MTKLCLWLLIFIFIIQIILVSSLKANQLKQQQQQPQFHKKDKSPSSPKNKPRKSKNDKVPNKKKQEKKNTHPKQKKPRPTIHITSNQPNIILFLTDDQDLTLGGLNSMPQLRNLIINQGATFNNFFVSTPVCCPSRTSYLSGRYIHNGGAVSNQCDDPHWRNGNEKTTYAVYAKEAGYRTSYAGKYLNDYALRASSLSLLPVFDDFYFIL